MSWHEVAVKVGEQSLSGMLNDSLLQIPYVEDLGESITVNRKDYKVISFMVDHRDNILKIILAKASPTKEKSDDKPIKRAD